MTALSPRLAPDRPGPAEPHDCGPVRVDTVDRAVAELRAGRPVFVVDDVDRENEGDVILAAALAEQPWIGWTIRHTSGVVCAPMPDGIADALGLPAMVEDNQDPRRTAYTVSTDARAGITTGIGAADRTRTLRLLADPGTSPQDLVRPGHVFPLRARPGGVLERPGHTEAAVDLCRLAQLPPVGVIAEVVGDDGEPLRAPALRVLADAEGFALISIADLADRMAALADPTSAPADRADRPAGATDRTAPAATAVPPAVSTAVGTAVSTAVSTAVGTAAEVPRVARAVQTTLPTACGRFTTIGFRDLHTGVEHVALVADPPAGGPGAGGSGVPLVRVHSECLTGDTLGSLRCDCGPQLHQALRSVAEHGGAVIYLRGHEGRGIGLLAKLSAYALQDHGRDTVQANLELGLPADAREYGAAAAILRELGLERVALLTNNPAKVRGLREQGIDVVERIGLQIPAGEHNARYLRTKRDLMGHLLDVGNVRETIGDLTRDLTRDAHGDADPNGEPVVADGTERTRGQRR